MTQESKAPSWTPNPARFRVLLECGVALGPDSQNDGETVLRIKHDAYQNIQVADAVAALPSLAARVKVLEGALGEIVKLYLSDGKRVPAYVFEIARAALNEGKS